VSHGVERFNTVSHEKGHSMGRRAIGDAPMTDAERQARSRGVRAATIAGELELARRELADWIAALGRWERSGWQGTLSDIRDGMRQAEVHLMVAIALNAGGVRGAEPLR